MERIAVGILVQKDDTALQSFHKTTLPRHAKLGLEG